MNEIAKILNSKELGQIYMVKTNDINGDWAVQLGCHHESIGFMYATYSYEEREQMDTTFDSFGENLSLIEELFFNQLNDFNPWWRDGS